LAKRFNKVVIYSQRSSFLPQFLPKNAYMKRMYISLVERAVLEKSDVLIALTTEEVHAYRRLGLKNRIEILPNGVDTSTCEATEIKSSESILKFLSRLNGSPFILWMSRIEPRKGLDIFLDAFQLVGKIEPDLHAVIAGPDQKNLLVALLNKYKDSKIGHRVHYAGILSGDDRYYALMSANMLVLPTAGEGMSNVLLEAMASGCPVITTPQAYFPEIGSSKAGLIVDREPKAIATAIKFLSNLSNEARKEMGVQGKKLVLENYNWTTIASRYARLCEELVGKSNRSKML